MNAFILTLLLWYILPRSTSIKGNHLNKMVRNMKAESHFNKSFPNDLLGFS